MSKHTTDDGKVSFGSKKDKEIWELNGILRSLNFINETSTLSIGNKELLDLSINQLDKLIKNK